MLWTFFLICLCFYSFVSWSRYSLICNSVKHFLKVYHSSCFLKVRVCSLSIKVLSVFHFLKLSSLLLISNLFLITIFQHIFLALPLHLLFFCSPLVNFQRLGMPLFGMNFRIDVSGILTCYVFAKSLEVYSSKLV